MRIPLPHAGARRRGRALTVLCGFALVIAGLVLGAMPASAHAAEISADCDNVTVNLTGFPSQGTDVHIAVVVGNVGSTSKDVHVGDQDMTVTVPISSLTAQLNGETANVVVDVTWDFFGQPQHKHESVPVTCGEKTSTSVSGETSTSVANTSTSVASSSTSAPMTVTTTGGVVTTETSTSIAAGPITALSTPSTMGPTSSVSGTSATSLPFTGSAALPLIVLGVALVLAGAGFTIAQRQRL